MDISARGLPDVWRDFAWAFGAVAAVASIQMTVTSVNGPTRGMALMYAPAIGLVTIYKSAIAGIITAIIAAFSFVWITSHRTGEGADGLSALLVSMTYMGVVGVTALARMTRVPKIKPRHLIGWLPFVEERNDGRLFWAVEATGDFAADCETGRLMAIDMIADMRSSAHTNLLGWVVADIQKKAEFTGVEVGFCAEVARQLLTDHNAGHSDIKGRVVNGHHNGHAGSVGNEHTGPDYLS